MACDYERISAYWDGALDSATREEVEVHLKHCEACRRELERFKRTSTLIGELIAQPDVHQCLMERIEREEAASQRPGRSPRSRRWLAAAAVFCVALAAALYLALARPRDEGQPVTHGTHASGPVPSIDEGPDGEGEATQDVPAVQVAAVPGESFHEGGAPGMARVDELPLILTGTTTGPEPTAVIANIEEDTSGTFSTGDSVLPGVELVEVAADHVVLENQGVREVLELGGDASNKGRPPIDGLWKLREWIGDRWLEAPREITIKRRGHRLTFVRSKGSDWGKAFLSGNRVIARFINVGEGAEVPMEGAFNDERTMLELAGRMRLSPGMEPRPVKYEFTKIDTGPQELDEKMRRLEKEVAEMHWAILAYAKEHCGRFPANLDEAGEEYERTTGHFVDLDGNEQVFHETVESRHELFADTRSRRVTYHHPTGIMPGTGVWPRPWPDHQPYSPERLKAYESALERQWGSKFRNPEPLLTVTYSDPAVVITADVLGRVTTAPRAGGATGVGAVADASSDQATEAEDMKRCRTNLRQLSLSLTGFHGSDAGSMPPGWLSLYDYNPQSFFKFTSFTCPADKPNAISYEIVFPAVNEERLVEIALAVGTAVDDLPEEQARQRLRLLSDVPIVIEKHAHPDGRRNVLFYGGRVESLTPEMWAIKVKPYLKYR